MYLILFDFDNTLIKYYTGGYLKRSEISEIADQYFTSASKRVIQYLLKHPKQFKLGVVTHSDDKHAPSKDEYVSGAEMVFLILSYVFGEDSAKKFYIVGAYPPWNEGMKPGKLYHIDKIINQIYIEKSMIIPNECVLLFDDLEDNVNLAIKYGYKSIKINPATGFCECNWSDGLVELME